jgi:alginate O-acetyltransferase complex protein AlgI
MSFVSVSFACLYLAALLVRMVAGGASGLYVGALLTLSWIFYAWHVPAYLVLLLFSTGVDYLAARAIDAPGASTGRRRAVLLVSVALNLGLLAYFKYARFLLESFLPAVDSTAWIASDLVLPVGISFYTFQSMSYTIDVYRGQLRAERSFTRLACYIAFFPQLVAGPIVRAGGFLPQLDRPQPLSLAAFGAGGYLIVRGLFFKIVVADNLGAVVDRYWSGAASTGGDGVVVFSLLVFFACQLFADFAGYTDIARGLACQLGFRLPVNFNAPYVAGTFSEFWRRWHVTLSTWFRDYLYIPLGGNRRGAARGLINLFLVMLVAGLWHGASWTFVLWGALHGAALAVERGLGFSRGVDSRPASVAWCVMVQLTWVISMGLFRASDASEAWRIIGNAMVGLTSLNAAASDHLPAAIVAGWWLVLPVALLHFRAVACERFGMRRNPYEKGLYAGAMTAAIVTLYTPTREFIYLQF